MTFSPMTPTVNARLEIVQAWEEAGYETRQEHPERPGVYLKARAAWVTARIHAPQLPAIDGTVIAKDCYHAKVDGPRTVPVSAMRRALCRWRAEHFAQINIRHIIR